MFSPAWIAGVARLVPDALNFAHCVAVVRFDCSSGSASSQLRVSNMSESRLCAEPLDRPARSIFRHDVMLSCGTVCSGTTASAHRYTAVRLGMMVLVEQSAYVRRLV